NYRRLGLTCRINGATGGSEKKNGDKGSEASARDRLEIAPGQREVAVGPSEVRVERDAKGAITRVIRSEEDASAILRRRKRNPLNDPLNDLTTSESSDGEGNPSNGRSNHTHNGDGAQRSGIGVIPELEEFARRQPAKRPRKVVASEQEWIEKLVDRHGDDYEKMFWDRRLNPMQHTENDIRRIVERWRKKKAASGPGDR
ncbi:MAG: Nucleolar protein 16, partial [Lichina confinis]